MITSQADFTNQTFSFFDNVLYILRELTANELVRRKIGIDQLVNLINQLSEALLEESRDQVANGIIKGLRDERESGSMLDGRDGFDLLYTELVYYNTRFNYRANQRAFVEIPTKEKLETSEVVLGSVQKLIKKLPGWLQKILEVLSEALGIAKALTGHI